MTQVGVCSHMLPQIVYICVFIIMIIGAFGVLWFILWMILAYDTPEDHPRVTEVEKRYIQDSLVGETSKTIDRNVST